jgi:hypothetical protein
MKAWTFLITAVLFVVFLLPAGRSVESTATRNPAGYGTIPQSSFRSGLVNTPNPIDPTGNLLITGNVRRGMHFRGSIPYQSTTSFNASLGSSALNSFLRDTAGSEDFIDRSNKYRIQPFYSPTQTVTTMVPGRSEVFSPMGMRIDDRVRQGTSFVSNGSLGLDSSSGYQISLNQDINTGDSDFQEYKQQYPSVSFRMSEHSRDTGRVDELVPGQLGIRQARDIPADRYREGDWDKDRGKQDLAIDSRQDSESGFGDSQQRQNLPVRDEIPELRIENEECRIPNSKLENPESDVRSIVFDDRREILDDIRRQLDALTKSVEADLQKDVGSAPDTQDPMLDEGGRDGSLWPSVSGDKTMPGDRIMPGDRKRTGTGTCPYENYENLESFSKARFNLHISAAEDHLKAGRYYRAVDSYTLAAIYQPDNPVVLAGKSHALFAAGEYMSSALFLARALDVQPKYIQTKVDFEAMLGGADKLSERITDVKQWVARSGSAQLHFLLSYVYFHTGKLNQAKQAIAAAYEKMPDSPAVVALRTAINQAAR